VRRLPFPATGRIAQHGPVRAPCDLLRKGKAEVLAELRRATGADLVVVCNELIPARIRNLERVVGCPVLDATALSARGASALP
jgi:50S ribosomal subunit-associated GTPase HflX